MKSLMFAILTLGASMCVSLSAMGADVTAIEVECASQESLAKAIAKVGGFVDQPMLSACAAALIPEIDRNLGGVCGNRLTITCDDAELAHLAKSIVHDPEDGLLDRDETRCSRSATRLPDGCIFRAVLDGGFCRSVAEALEPMTREELETLCGIRRIEVSLWVTDMGIDVRGALHLDQGSRLAKGLDGICDLGADPFARMSDRSVLSFAYGSDGDYSGQVEKLLDAMRRNGARIDFVGCTTVDGFANLQIDVDRLLKEKDEIDFGKLAADFENAVKEIPDPEILLKAALQGASITLKGVSCGTDVRRGRDVFPGDDLSKCDCVATFSPYRLARALIPSLVEGMGLAVPKLDVDSLPPGDGADIGVKFWKDGSCYNMMLRATSAEIRGCAAVAMQAVDLYKRIVSMLEGRERSCAEIVIGKPEGRDGKKPQAICSVKIEIGRADRPAKGGKLDYNGFRIVRRTKNGHTKTTYQLTRHSGSENKVVREICATPTKEEREFDEKWLSGIELASDKKELEMVAYRRIAKHVLKLVEDMDDGKLKMLVVGKVVENVRDRKIRPRAGKPGITRAILDVIVGDIPEVTVSWKAKPEAAGN